MKFSERFGHSKVDDVIIVNKLTPEIEIAIINWIAWCAKTNTFSWRQVEYNVWEEDLNNDVDLFPNPYDAIADIISPDKRYVSALKSYFKSSDLKWHEKLDLVEAVLKNAQNIFTEHFYEKCVAKLNGSFEKLNFGYRCIAEQIEPITSTTEIQAVEKALTHPNDKIKLHIASALEHLSAGQAKPDCRNSIKESISAVEAYCRIITKKKTLGEALNELEKHNISMNPQLKQGFVNLYNYTNDQKTGIRHALIEDDYIPTVDDATFMLITCSAFINYLTIKVSLNKKEQDSGL